MSDHHPIDLAALNARLGSHSIYAPSYSPTWLTCEGSLLPSVFAEDTAGRDAAYGTVGHEVGEIWLNRIKQEAGGTKLIRNMKDLVDTCEPRELIGTFVTIVQRPARDDMNDDLEFVRLPEVSFEIERDQEMFDFVRQYVVWCAELSGEHLIEQRVDFSVLTPIPGQGGTMDFAALAPGRAIGVDLKMGIGIPVQAAYIDALNPAALIEMYGQLTFNGNPQVLLYLIGVFLEWDWLYHFEVFEIRIAQPRRDTFEIWETNREEIFKFMEWVKERAAKAWVPGAPRRPSKKGCEWCKLRGSCPALLAWLAETQGSKMDDAGAIPVEYTVPQMAVAAEAFVSRRNHFRDFRNPAELSTEALEMALDYRVLIDKWFRDIEITLLNRAIGREMLNRFQISETDTHRRVADHAGLVVFLRRKGIQLDEIYKDVLISPAQAEDLIRRKLGLKKKAAAELLAHFFTKPPGQMKLVPVTSRKAVVLPDTDKLDDAGL